jgi:hypothetical protein
VAVFAFEESMIAAIPSVEDGRLGGARRLMRERRGAKPGNGRYKIVEIDERFCHS